MNVVFGIAALAHAIILEHGQGLFLRFYPVRGCRSFRKYFPWRSGFYTVAGIPDAPAPWESGTGFPCQGGLSNNPLSVQVILRGIRRGKKFLDNRKNPVFPFNGWSYSYV
ncbi:hypothetical protein [Akkermansia muciniphila]|uniref:hypothetical protein n=1 Tax=Akkermansia muciniphila TaxID=239935 RepID=UPI0011AEE26C|nr:hypothetical protein [Akkermansia muciniphila]